MVYIYIFLRAQVKYLNIKGHAATLNSGKQSCRTAQLKPSYYAFPFF